MSHEYVYVDAITSEARKHGDVEAVTIEVGKLAPIPAAELEKALSFTGWRITIIENPGVVHCRCGYKGAPKIIDKGHDYTIFQCPACGADLPPIIAGKDVILKDVTVRE